MKIWRSYGTEHSMNLVMIGRFKTREDAKSALKLIKELQTGLQDKFDVIENTNRNRYSDEVMDLFRRLDCYNFHPMELEQFLYDNAIRLEDSNIILTTEESDVSAFFKIMIENGARVEIFSNHDYPDSEYGRGK